VQAPHVTVHCVAGEVLLARPTLGDPLLALLQWQRLRRMNGSGCTKSAIPTLADACFRIAGCLVTRA
jgi:hypothetical protein